MANYYTLFSLGIEADTSFERNWMKEAADRIFDCEGPDAEEWVMPCCEIDENGAWIYTEESASIEPVIKFAQEYLTNFHPDRCITFEWAHTCSKMRIDSFGGGAVFITADDEKWLSTAMWLHEMVSKWEAEKKKGNES